MKTSLQFVTYIEELLTEFPNLEKGRLFGGTTLGINEKKIGVIFGDTLFLKVTEKNLQKRYREEGSIQFSYTRKDKKDPVIIKNWWSAPEKALEDPGCLAKLVKEILEQSTFL